MQGASALERMKAAAAAAAAAEAELNRHPLTLSRVSTNYTTVNGEATNSDLPQQSGVLPVYRGETRLAASV